MCPPVAIPLLTPTQIADRMDPAAASLRSPARSPGRSPGRATADPLEFGPGSLRPSPRPQRGRRSTADGPSSGVSDRLSALQSELSSPSPVPAAASSAPLPDNPFTSRPPSSASEVEIEIGGSSTVSSPVPRPLTARGRYSVDIQGEDAAGRSSADTLGRSSADSALRRSFSSDVAVDGLPVSVLADAAEDEDMFASDSSSSRPSSRQNNLGSSDSRRLIERSISRSRQLLARRPSLSRLHEEEIPFERAATASLALAPLAPPAASRGEQSDEVEVESDVPLDTFDAETPPLGPFDLAPDEIPPAAGDEVEVADTAEEEIPTADPLLLLDESPAVEMGEERAGEENSEEQEIMEQVVAEVAGPSDGRLEAEQDTSGQSQQELSRRTNRDVSLLSRHIDHMLRICRAPVSDPSVPRPRREIIRLQGIRRMLEDLQRQIRQLQDTAREAVAPEPMRSIALGPSLRPYQQHARAQARARGRPVSGPVSRSRLTRAHTQLVSQLRATVRAMEMSPDLAQSPQPAAEAVVTPPPASEATTEEAETSASSPAAPATPPPPAAAASTPASAASTPTDVESAARNDLRSMSQRLERLLRQRRELMESLGTEIRGEVSSALQPRPGPQAPPYYPPLLDSSSQSEEEEEDRGQRPPSVNSDGFRRSSSSRIPVRQRSVRRGEAADTAADSYLRSRRMSSSIGAAGGDSWRPLSIRERLDIRAGLRRETERERVRLARERDLSLRRMRYGELGQLAGAGTSDRFPPLRELILRRLRGRGDTPQQDQEEGQPSAHAQESRESRRHREMLSWMVDQLTIHHETAATAEAEPDQMEPGTLPPMAPGPSRDLYSGSSVGERLPPRYPGPRQRDPVERAGQGAGAGQERDNLFIRAGERRLFRDYHFLHHGPSNIALTHRIQTWDFAKGDIPNISNGEENIVVKEAKIHNDASVDIAEDGSLLVTLVPSNLPMTTVVGLYSLNRANLGDCYATYSLESSAVSVSLSPTSRHLLVGLTSRTSRIISLSPMDRQLMAQVFRIKLPGNSNERGRLIHRRDINQVDYGHMSLNCIRWIPVPGQGIVFATNTGLLKILR